MGEFGPELSFHARYWLSAVFTTLSTERPVYAAVCLNTASRDSDKTIVTLGILNLSPSGVLVVNATYMRVPRPDGVFGMTPVTRAFQSREGDRIGTRLLVTTEFREVSIGPSGCGDTLRSPSYFKTARAALSITSATSLGCET